MKRLILVPLLLAGLKLSAAPNSVFRLHLLSEPTTLSPFHQRSSSSLYFLSQLQCPLLKWDNEKIKDWGGRCHFQKKTRVVCEINPTLKFQNGQKVEAKHYLQSFQAFLNPQKPSPRAEILYGIKNARAVLTNQKKASELGLRTEKNRLIIDLETADPDFLLALSNPLLTAVWDPQIPSTAAAEQFVSCGPYQIEKWSLGSKIRLKPNPHFPLGHKARPDLEFLFINEDSLALQAYQKNELDFLRRLPTLYLPQWQQSPELHLVNQVRLDSLAFLNKNRDPDLARALAQAIDFEAWRKLYHAKPRPGCFGTPDRWTKGPVCWDFSIEKAKESLAKVKDPSAFKNLRLSYSKQGGDDHDRTMEFLQDQWKKNLNLNVRIEALENKVFLDKLKNQNLNFFRKGVAPERPGCRAVLENYSMDSNENYPGFQDPEFEKILLQLQTASEKKRPELCRRGVEILRDRAQFIPTGPIFFSLLAKPHWKGWFLNELNDLDLSELHHQP